MLEQIEDGLDSFLRDTLGLDAVAVDVSFDPPNRKWSSKLDGPTVNAFMWDIRRSSERAKSGMQTVVRDGKRVHQPALPVVEMRFVITTWIKDPAEERRLLADLLLTLLKYDTLPRSFLGPQFDNLDEPTLTLALAGEDTIDVFKAIDGEIKAGLHIVVTTEVDIDNAIRADKTVGSVVVRSGLAPGDRSRNGDLSRADVIAGTLLTRRRFACHVQRADQRGAVGAPAYVRRTGATESLEDDHAVGDASYVNAAGWCFLRAAVGDEVTIEIDPPLRAVVPERGGVVFE